MQSSEANVAFRMDAELGEGSLWDVQHERLYWVDIAGKRLFAFNPKNGANLAYDVGEHVGTVVVTQNDKLLLGLRSGLGWLDPESGRVCKLLDPRPSGERSRFNDGKCDPRGRFWVGTMAEAADVRGSLFKLDLDGSVTAMIEGVRISNGLAWTRDATRFYYTDTATAQIWVYDFDAERGAISNRRVAVEIPKSLGAPDGFCIDADDHLWIALYGGGKVVRVDPSSGNFEYEVIVPARNTTSCAFGGPALDQLYITTARQGLGPEELRSEPFAGSLFRAGVPYRGVPAPRFAGNL